MLHYTPAKILNEFKSILSLGCSITDQRMLSEFFELPYDKDFSEMPIRKIDPDKFKPLCNFLKKGIQTREKNIELLAWLIDFRPRPYSNYWRSVNAVANPLSDLAINRGGVLEEHALMPTFAEHRRERKYNATEVFDRRLNEQAYQATQGIDNDYGNVPNSGEGGITIEYPSGVKLSVGTYDLSLIAALVRL